MSCKIYLFGEKKSEKKKKWREKKNEYVVRKMEGKKTMWGTVIFLEQDLLYLKIFPFIHFMV